MRIIFIIITLFVINVASIDAQYSTFFLGHVYYENTNTGKQEMIPFATIKMYDRDNPQNLLATRFSELNGSYIIKGFDTKLIYIIEVCAPGFECQKFITKSGIGVKSGNVSTHTRLEKRKNTEFKIKKTSYTLKELFPNQKKISIIEFVKKIPEIEVDGDDIYTANGSVRILCNGMNIEAKGLGRIKKFNAAKIVERIDFYDLSDINESGYSGILDIRFMADEESTPPTYKLITLEKYE